MGKMEYCYECDKDVIAIVKREKNNYTYRGKSFMVIEEVRYCPHCHSELLNNNLDNSMYNIYNAYLELFDLSFEKIKEIRTSLNLSQEVFSKILGWSKKSIVRYENNDSIPQGEYLNTYMILNENPYYIVKLLERQKNNFSTEEYFKILNMLPFNEMYKTINAVLYILKDNKLCETLLMKHLFAVDFYNYKENGIAITNLKYAHLPYGPVVDNRNDLYNFMIKNGYIKLEFNDIGTNFIADTNYEKEIFTDDEIKSLDYVKTKLKGYTAGKISDWSHNFKGYKETKNGQIIDYKYAKYLDFSNL